MKRFFIILASFAFTVSVMAQEQQWVEKTKIITVGQEQLEGGKCTVQLNSSLDTACYFVLLTPVGQYAELYLMEKSNTFFLVKSDSGEDVHFQYIVIERKRKEVYQDIEKQAQ